MVDCYILAHRIRISEILPWDRKRCHVRATYIGCIGRQVMPLLCLNNVIMYICILAYSGTFGNLCKNSKKNSGEREK